MIIAIDFDGTIAEHRFPLIGPPVPGAFEWMKRFQALGAKLILWTMRSNRTEGSFLVDAVDFCREHGITFWDHNRNPQQHTWSLSPKCYAHVYIDDAAFGCPLIPDSDGQRPMVDWSRVGPEVERMILGEPK